MRRLRLAVLALISLASCASSPEPAPTKQVSRPATVPTAKPQPPRYIVVSRNAPLFSSANDTTPMLQFRSHDAQLQVDAKLKDEMQRYAEKKKKAYAAEIKKEKKRMRRFKKRDQRVAYAEKRRLSRARRHLKAIEKKALQLGEGHPAERFIVLSIVDETPQRWKVHTLIDDEETPHCYRDGLAGLGKVRMTVWVDKSDVEHVTSRRDKFEIWQGSSIETTAGVVVRRDETGTYVHVDGYRIDVPVPDDALATHCRPSTPFEAPITDKTFTDIALAEGLLTFSKTQVFPFNPWVDNYVTGTLRIGPRFFATTQTRCASITVHADETLLEPAGRRKTLRLTASAALATPPFVPEGTRLYTPDGEAIGLAWDALHLGTPYTVPGSKRPCFLREVWPAEIDAPYRSLVWCADADAITQ